MEKGKGSRSGCWGHWRRRAATQMSGQECWGGWVQWRITTLYGLISLSRHQISLSRFNSVFKLNFRFVAFFFCTSPCRCVIGWKSILIWATSRPFKVFLIIACEHSVSRSEFKLLVWQMGVVRNVTGHSLTWHAWQMSAAEIFRCLEINHCHFGAVRIGWSASWASIV